MLYAQSKPSDWRASLYAYNYKDVEQTNTCRD
jgi:hypothetical protein